MNEQKKEASLALTVTEDLPGVPLVVVDSKLMERVRKAHGAVKGLAIVDEQSLNKAGAYLRTLTDLQKQVEDERKQVKEPFLNMCRSIDEAAKGPKERLGELKKAVQDKIRLHNEQAQAEKAALQEAEKARQAELDEAERRRREEAAAAAAAPIDFAPPPEEAAVPAERESIISKEEFEALNGGAPDFAPPPEPPPEAPDLPAPKPPEEKPAGVAMRCRLRYEVTNIMKLPPTLTIFEPDKKEITKRFVTNWKDGDALPICPGLKFWVEKTPVSTGKSGEETEVF